MQASRKASAAAIVIVLGLAPVAGCGTTGTTGAGGTTGTTGPSTPPPPSTTASTTAPSTATNAPGPGGTANPPVTTGVHVWFLNHDHAVTGEEPLYEPVDRRVQPPAVAAGALDALYAGPTAAEQAAGLQLITSGSTGYTRLHIADGIAYVTLAGGCDSKGSTMTVAGEIMPTLKQFASVTHVKIFAPDGSTESPTGPVDSIPTCLEP